jgi:hypothetical protein
MPFEEFAHRSRLDEVVMTLRSCAGTIVLSSLCLTMPALAVEWTDFEGSARGFPVLRSGAGARVADGDFFQWIQDGKLHVRIVYSTRGRRVEEHAVFRQRPELIQDEWSFREERNGKVYREFRVNLSTGAATAKKQDEKELKEWSEQVKIEPGRTFAGFGFTLAIKALRKRLLNGEHVELSAIGFTPKPRVASVELTYGGLDRMRMANRTLTGERFVIHPKIPWIADLVVDIPDTHIWLTSPPPAGFLRWEGPLSEPNDDVVRVDLLPGDRSGPAIPVKAAASRK